MAFITAENAAELQRKGVEAKRLNNPANASGLPTDPYLRRQAMRVRKQIDLLNDAIEAELIVDIPAVPPSKECPEGIPAIGPNTLKIDRYAKSIKNLSEREAKVCGRPDPGSFRPTEARKPRSSGFTPAPQDIEPGQ